MDEQVALLKSTNINQLRIACQDSLQKVKKNAKAVAGSYYLTWSFKKYVYSMASEELTGMIKSESTKRAVIQDFMEKDLDDEYNQIASSTKKIGVTVMIAFAIGMYAYWNNYIQKLRQWS